MWPLLMAKVKWRKGPPMASASRYSSLPMLLLLLPRRQGGDLAPRSSDPQKWCVRLARPTDRRVSHIASHNICPDVARAIH
ncbi:hypothetical protein AAVH_16855 [Aphelenchoides avenae]|nr:hypothetical protein AAVH_16855 [Aphelenchus avenae]